MFKIFRLPMYYPRAVRGMHILFILLKFVIANWLSSQSYTYWLVPKRYKRNGEIQTLAERLRTIIEELGPTFVKFGQILADRPDVVSDKLREELKKLQSRVEPFDNKLAIELIEAELAGNIDDIFEEFNCEPIAAASIGQVYSGTLRGGEKVMIKIQRPNIEGKIRLDLHILEYFAQQLVKEFPGLQVVDMVGLVEEFGNTFLQELNYLNEASNAIRFGAMFKDVPFCKIPKVYLKISTARLLILEDVTGAPPDNPEHLIQLGYDPKEIARNGILMFLEMIFKHGFFHADPHPGNLFILPGNTVAMIDFGMAGTLKPTHMQFLAGFILGLANMDAKILTDSLLILCDKKFFSEKADLEFSVNEMLVRYRSFSYEKIDFSNMLNECVKIILTYKLKLPSSIYLLLKALSTIERFGHNLDKKISLHELVRPYAEEMVKAKYSPGRIAGEAFDLIKDYGELIRDFPTELNEILYRMKEGKLIFDIQISDKDAFTKTAKQFVTILSTTILIGCMQTGAIVLNIWGKQSTASNLMFNISLFFAIWLLIRLFFKLR